jgi:3-isopropylmalate/(R)-2-methylmalate dehydratase small subunit
MQKFTLLDGLVVPLDRANVDTDAIIPKQFLKSIKRSGFGVNAFDEWRYLDHGEPGMDNSKRKINPDFVLNKVQYKGAQILLTRENFGCGSSREHAPWALEDFGLRAIIAPSYADIFFNNCFKNGLLPIRLDAALVDKLFKAEAKMPGFHLKIDLEQQKITAVDGTVYPFEVEAFRKHCLLNGLDDIGLTMQHVEVIKKYEQRRKEEAPWLFA